MKKNFNLFVLIFNLLITVLSIIGYHFTPLSIITEVVFYFWYIFSAILLILGIVGFVFFGKEKKAKILGIVNICLCMLPWLTIKFIIDVLK